MITNFKKNKKERSLKNTAKSLLFWFLLLTTLVFLAITNVKIIYRRQKLSLSLQNLEKEIKTLEKKNEELRAKISQSGTKEYLEKVAREQFNLKAPGEEVVVISKEDKNQEQEELDNSRPEETESRKFDFKRILDFLNSFWKQ